MPSNPMEELGPGDEPYNDFTIKFHYDEESCNWSAYCREWKCELHAKTATEAAEKITSEIDKHNDECFEQILNEAIDKNPNAVLNAMCDWAAKQTTQQTSNK